MSLALAFLAGVGVAVVALLWPLLRMNRRIFEGREALLGIEKSRALLGLELEQKQRELDLARQEIEGGRIRSAEERERQRLEFESISQRFIDQSGEKWHKTSREGLERVVKPLDEELKRLESKIQEVYDRESRERLSLQKEISMMLKAQEQMTLEASSLTRALKGDAKTQGLWGEMVLERILESSGLREGEEFVVQGRGLGLKSEDGQARKPDVLVHLPGERHLIIDSKVSLANYESYIRAEGDGEKAEHLHGFIQSMRRHVEGLAEKDYAGLYGVQSPDFTMLFVPTDGAFSMAHQGDPTLFQWAMEKRVAIVSPSLLFPNLRTVESIWRRERQNKNAEEIARQAGGLYDKFVGLLEDLASVGQQIGRTQNLYDDAMLKLRSGKGNLVDRVEKLKLLGAKAKKQIEGASLCALVLASRVQ